MKLEFTQRGFARGEFTDAYGAKCSLQASSSAEEQRVWLGTETDRMHLNRSQVAGLLPHLQAFVNTGDFTAVDEKAVAAAHAIEGREALADALNQAAANLEDEGYHGLANALRWLADPTPDEDDTTTEESALEGNQ